MTGQGYHKAACPPCRRGEGRSGEAPETLQEGTKEHTRKHPNGTNKMLVHQHQPIVQKSIAKAKGSLYKEEVLKYEYHTY